MPVDCENRDRRSAGEERCMRTVRIGIVMVLAVEINKIFKMYSIDSGVKMKKLLKDNFTVWNHSCPLVRRRHIVAGSGIYNVHPAECPKLEYKLDYFYTLICRSRKPLVEGDEMLLFVLVDRIYNTIKEEITEFGMLDNIAFDICSNFIKLLQSRNTWLDSLEISTWVTSSVENAIRYIGSELFEFDHARREILSEMLFIHTAIVESKIDLGIVGNIMKTRLAGTLGKITSKEMKSSLESVSSKNIRQIEQMAKSRRESLEGTSTDTYTRLLCEPLIQLLKYHSNMSVPINFLMYRQFGEYFDQLVALIGEFGFRDIEIIEKGVGANGRMTRPGHTVSGLSSKTIDCVQFTKQAINELLFHLNYLIYPESLEKIRTHVNAYHTTINKILDVIDAIEVLVSPDSGVEMRPNMINLDLGTKRISLHDGSRKHHMSKFVGSGEPSMHRRLLVEIPRFLINFAANIFGEVYFGVDMSLDSHGQNIQQLELPVLNKYDGKTLMDIGECDSLTFIQFMYPKLAMRNSQRFLNKMFMPSLAAVCKKFDCGDLLFKSIANQCIPNREKSELLETRLDLYCWTSSRTQDLDNGCIEEYNNVTNAMLDGESIDIVLEFLRGVGGKVSGIVRGVISLENYILGTLVRQNRSSLDIDDNELAYALFPANVAIQYIYTTDNRIGLAMVVKYMESYIAHHFGNNRLMRDLYSMLVRGSCDFTLPTSVNLAVHIILNDILYLVGLDHEALLTRYCEFIVQVIEQLTVRQKEPIDPAMLASFESLFADVPMPARSAPVPSSNMGDRTDSDLRNLLTSARGYGE
jgi:hypothetical protein